MNNKEILLNKVNSIEAITKLNNLGKVYFVGGIVRDLFLNKESKDIDLIVCNIELDEIKDILSSYGTVNEVGESFGVIKFLPNGWSDEDIDIALPRTDKKVGTGHKGIKSISDPFLPIETDLERRDFTLNAIAMDLEGNILDPFNGQKDINDEIIRCVSTKSFVEDPLRMMRAIQFSSRFGFKLEKETFELIKKNKHLIKTITNERILIEMDKIFFKGDLLTALLLLEKTKIGTLLFPNVVSSNNLILLKFKDRLTLKGDFYQFFFLDGEEYKIFSGDLQTSKEIDAYRIMHKLFGNLYQLRKGIFDAIQKTDTILESGILNNIQNIKNELDNFRSGKLPKRIKDLAINGKDLIDKGYNGINIGYKQRELLEMILKEEVENKKEKLIKLL